MKSYFGARGRRVWRGIVWKVLVGWGMYFLGGGERLRFAQAAAEEADGGLLQTVSKTEEWTSGGARRRHWSEIATYRSQGMLELQVET